MSIGTGISSWLSSVEHASFCMNAERKRALKKKRRRRHQETGFAGAAPPRSLDKKDNRELLACAKRYHFTFSLACSSFSSIRVFFRLSAFRLMSRANSRPLSCHQQRRIAGQRLDAGSDSRTVGHELPRG